MNILERIERVQNSKRQLRWGHCKMTNFVNCGNDFVLKPVEQYVLVCGHNFYRTVRTLVLEIYSDGTSSVFMENDLHQFDCICAYGTDDFVIEVLIAHLKDWFPACVMNEVSV